MSATPSKISTSKKHRYIGAVAINVASVDQVLQSGKAHGVYVATAGDLACIMHDGSAVVFAGLAAKTIYQFGIRQVTKTGTTITGHVLY